MKKSLTRFLKIGLPIIGVASVATALPLALTSCGSSNDGGSAALNNMTTKNTDDTYSFDTNEHNNVNIADMAAIVNANELNYMYNTLNNPALKPFIKWLSTKKILVVDGQIPNPKWIRVPDKAPDSQKSKIQDIQNDFVLCTPTIYSLLYSSPTNRELPGFGMQMALPTNKDNLKTLESYWKGQIVAQQPGKPSNNIFTAMEGSADIVLYVYPGTATWITKDLAQEALKPLLTTNSQSHSEQAIIPVTLAQGFDSLNSPIGMIYLFQSLLNGIGYSQDINGNWTKDPQANWPCSLQSLYNVENASSSDLKSVDDFLNSITPYFELTNTFGLDLSEYDYTEKGKTAIFPFAEKYIKTLTDNTKNTDSNYTLSAYFNDTSMLLALGFAPQYSTYIIDPGTAFPASDPRHDAGVIMPGYVTNIYPNLVNTSSDTPKDNGTTIPLKQSATGIWQHHVEPKIPLLRAKKIGTILADDWLMPKVNGIYNNGNSIVNHIIYNTQGDYTTNGQVFFTKDNTSAQHNSKEAIVNTSISNTGFMPTNMMNGDFTIGGQSYFDYCYDNSTTGQAGDTGNVINDNFQGFQWFANQIEGIKGNEFQMPKLSYFYLNNVNGVATKLNTEIDNFASYDWNVEEVQEATIHTPPIDSDKNNGTGSGVTTSKNPNASGNAGTQGTPTNGKEPGKTDNKIPESPTTPSASGTTNTDKTVNKASTTNKVENSSPKGSEDTSNVHINKDVANASANA